jgi:hypothetical protein
LEKQLLLFSGDARGTTVAAFLDAAYAMVNNDDAIACPAFLR